MTSAAPFVMVGLRTHSGWIGHWCEVNESGSVRRICGKGALNRWVAPIAQSSEWASECQNCQRKVQNADSF